MPKILVVDDEPQIRRILTVMLTEAGFEVTQAESGEVAVVLRPEVNPDVVLLDMSMPGMGGLATLKTLLAQGENLDCIMMTAYGTIRSAVDAMRLGAFDYLTKPFDNDELLLIVSRALEMRRLTREVDHLRAELSARYGFNEIVGISPKLQLVFRAMAKIASVDATLLIEGESGTGKEMVARAIHRRSPRRNGPFIAVNCGAIPQSLFEAEFFGYDKGAFTDARQSRAGHFEQAQGGTLFLDEVGELPLDMQVKLLRALQNHEIVRLGGSHSIKTDLRVIAATNLDIKTAVEQNRFREDLYWRLNVVKILVPSLRERREDIPLIVDHMLARLNAELGLAVRSISTDARKLLNVYDWPGNVRELENAICSAMIMSENDIVTASDLPSRIRGEIEGTNQDSNNSHPRESAHLSLAEAVNEARSKMEKEMIISRLSELNSNRTAAAESLGISRKSLFNKMRQYGLTNDDIESGT